MLNSRRRCYPISVRRRGSSPVGYVASYRFVRGVQYAIALGLLDKGEVVAGVLGCPNLPLASIASGVSTYSSEPIVGNSGVFLLAKKLLRNLPRGLLSVVGGF